MQIEVNDFVIEYLEKYKIQSMHTDEKRCRFQKGQIINVPEFGYMEEYSCINQGINLCQMGSISYSNAVIPRLDMQVGRYCSIAVGLDFIKGNHPLGLISTSSCTYDPNFYIFKDSAKAHNGEYFAKDWKLYYNLVPPPPPQY